MGDQNFTHGEAPAWVKPCDFPVDEGSLKPSQVNVQCLLFDVQRNWEEKTKYAHYAYRVLSQWGAEDISKLEIVFAPSYEKVVVHGVRVLRDGQWEDRLGSARVKVLQKEQGLEQGLYNGDLTLVYFLDDVREGDIVEYAFSRIGEPPLSASKLVGLFYLQFQDAVEKIHYRLLGHRDLPLQIKSFNTTIEPRVADVNESLREWVWEVAEAHPASVEENEPDWYDANAHVEVSLFDNWGEVAKETYPFYTLPADFAASVPEAMRELIEEWKGSAKTQSELALKAVRFVQDEVRYLALAEGIMGWKPAHPVATFERRFGDCKDKSFLLHALLGLMEIRSTPVLVHASVGKGVPERLPTPYFANHVVLQIEVGGMVYWVDPTLSLQGGSLESNHFPNYEWGLLISEQTEDLVDLPREVRKNPTEIESCYVLKSEDAVSVKIQMTWCGSRADYIRRALKVQGRKKFAHEHLTRIQKVYGWVEMEDPAEVVDDRENNVLRFTAFYKVEAESAASGKFVPVHSYILNDYLTEGVNPARSSLYEIPYPLWVRERIHIENPFIHAEAGEKEYVQKNESLSYTLKSRTAGISEDYEIELIHMQDHIPPRVFREYWNMVKDIYRNGPAEIHIGQ